MGGAILLVVLLLAAVSGGAFYYFKIMKPKKDRGQKAAATLTISILTRTTRKN